MGCMMASMLNKLLPLEAGQPGGHRLGGHRLGGHRPDPQQSDRRLPGWLRAVVSSSPQAVASSSTRAIASTRAVASSSPRRAG